MTENYGMISIKEDLYGQKLEEKSGRIVCLSLLPGCFNEKAMKIIRIFTDNLPIRVEGGFAAIPEH